jgi:hypothetical protein
MRKKAVHQGEGTRSMKTLFFYIALVGLLILISFSVKLYTVFQKSLFDGSHHFTVAVVKEGRVAEVIAFHPHTPSLALATIDGDKVPLSEMGQTLAVAPDAVIQVKEQLPVGEDVSAMMMVAAWHFPSVQTKMTLIDVIRLAMLSKNVQEDNKIVKAVKLPKQESDIDKIMTSFFSDETIATQNTPIHIVNASDIPGMGKRLERVLANVGANVIGVSTSPTPVEKSKIEYAGEEESYTVKKLKRILGLQTEQLQGQSGANIVITIGEDSEKTSAF